MTVVTTSRKPLPEVRTLSRDLAFAIGGRYVTRGKAGMGDLLSLDRSVVIVSRARSHFSIQFFSGDGSPAVINVRSLAIEERTGKITPGLILSDRLLYEAIKDRIDAVSVDEGLLGRRIIFDGTQRKRYTLEVTA